MSRPSTEPFGETLRRLMERRGLTYRALAEETRRLDGKGMTHAHINMLANGHDRPSLRAMELIAERGLPVVAPATTSAPLTGDVAPVVQAPLTTGFARTGYEIDVIEARAQKMSFAKAEASTHAEVKPLK